VALTLYLAGWGVIAWLGLTFLAPRSTEGELALALWILAVGAVTGATCGLLGTFLVLRRMSLVGDAISHAVLPGIALAYLLSGSVAGLPILLGAMLLGLATTMLTQTLTQWGRLNEDASLGIVFTSLFALGVILLQVAARHVDLDADCVLYGQIDFAGVDLVPLGSWEISRPLRMLVPALVVTLAVVLLLWKELILVAFDPALAAAMGFRVAWVHAVLMTLVAGVCVAAFEAVGSIVVVAMLVVPATTAVQLADRVGWVAAWSVAIGIASAILGYLLAEWWATSVAGAMAVAAGLQFAGALLLAPRRGLAPQLARQLAMAVRIASEDLLARLYRSEESYLIPSKEDVAAAGSPARAGLWQAAARQAERGWAGRLARWQLLRRGWVTRDRQGRLQLSPDGRTAARQLVRAHRLWESYLDTHFDLPRDHLHEAAERMEHFLPQPLQDELARELGDRVIDPHGQVIPPGQANAANPPSSR
jgi:ABC-type Mn2+/Zn2+ transport system permease subunit